MKKLNTNKGGFMLIQLMVGIVIIGILSGVVALNLSSFLVNQALNNSVDEVTVLLDEARSRTLAHDHGLSYGVHLEASQAVLFSGTTYSIGSVDNKTVILDSAIMLDSISLTGGGSEVMFDPLTGDTSEEGTFIVKPVHGTEGEKTVTVTHAGQVSSN